MLKELMGEILFQADVDHSRFITIHQIQKSLFFLFPQKRSRDAVLWSRRVLITSRLKKKIPLRHFRHTRHSIFKILLHQKASRYVFKNDSLVFLAAIVEYLHTNETY